MGLSISRLQEAAHDQNWTKVERLLPTASKASFNYDASGLYDQRNVLHLAVEHGAPLPLIEKILTIGLSKGLNLEAENYDHETALQCVLTYRQKPEVARLLLDHGADLERGLNHALALSSDNHTNVQFMISTHRGGEDGEAAGIELREFASVILEHPRSNQLDILTRLRCAILLSLPPTAAIKTSSISPKDQELIQSKLNEPDRKGKTLLHIACGIKDHPSDHLEMIRFLLDNGADVHARNQPEQWTPLHFAAHNGLSLFIVQLLVERGADLNAMDVNGKTPLHLAMKANEPHLFTILGGSTSTTEAVVPMRYS